MIQFIVRGVVENPPEEFKKLNNHYIAEYQNLTNEERRDLKQRFPQGYFRLGLWEEGGGEFDTGLARIICGIEGEKLKPSRTRKRGWLANSRHSLFVGNSLCIVEAVLENRKFEYTIAVQSIRFKIGILEEEIIWKGNREDLDKLKNYEYFNDRYEQDVIRKFIPALEAATKKALEYRCTYPLYILKEGEE